MQGWRVTVGSAACRRPVRDSQCAAAYGARHISLPCRGEATTLLLLTEVSVAAVGVREGALWLVVLLLWLLMMMMMKMMLLLLLLCALLGDERRWVRYRCPQTRCRAQVVSRGQFSQGSVRRGRQVELRGPLEAGRCGLKRRDCRWRNRGNVVFISWTGHLCNRTVDKCPPVRGLCVPSTVYGRILSR